LGQNLSGYQFPDDHDNNLHKILDLIPSNASILTQNDIFPHISGRRNAYVFPFSSTFENPTDFIPTLRTYISEVEYILIDWSSDPITSIFLFELNVTEQFGLLAEADGTLLLKRDYFGSPILFVAYTKIFNVHDLLLVNGQVVKDEKSGNPVLHHSTLDNIDDFWYGPGFFLSSGHYFVDYSIKISGSTDLNILQLAIIEWPAVTNIEMSGSQSMWFVPKLL